MEIINSDHFSQFDGETVATIGFFDGVHAGHRYLLEQLKTKANDRNLPSMVITFLQHPQTVLQAGFQPDLLSTYHERIERLSFSGIDYCLLLNFTGMLSGMNARDFIQKKLHKEWKVKLLVIGYDHRFGKNRSEGFEDYVKYGNECGLEIIQASEFPDMQISSTLIRNCLLDNNLQEANRMLSYCYRLEGKIIKGNRFGREIGFPTANLDVQDKNKIIPGEGVYAAGVYRGQKKYGGMVYIGKRPTLMNHGEPRIEVHLFDFSGDLYDETLQLEFIGFLRGSKKFENFAELKKQLFADREAAIKVLGITCKSCGN